MKYSINYPLFILTYNVYFKAMLGTFLHKRQLVSFLIFDTLFLNRCFQTGVFKQAFKTVQHWLRTLITNCKCKIM